MLVCGDSQCHIGIVMIVNQWICSDIGLCLYKMSESSSPSKTPEDEGSKSWEEWQVSVHTYMYILVVSFCLTHLLVSDILFVYSFTAFCMENFSVWVHPFYFLYRRTKISHLWHQWVSIFYSVILWQPCLVFSYSWSTHKMRT